MPVETLAEWAVIRHGWTWQTLREQPAWLVWRLFRTWERQAKEG